MDGWVIWFRVASFLFCTDVFLFFCSLDTQNLIAPRCVRICAWMSHHDVLRPQWCFRNTIWIHLNPGQECNTDPPDWGKWAPEHHTPDGSVVKGNGLLRQAFESETRKYSSCELNHSPVSMFLLGSYIQAHFHQPCLDCFQEMHVPRQ